MPRPRAHPRRPPACVVLKALGRPPKLASGDLSLRASQTLSVSSAPRESSVLPSREKARHVISFPAGAKTFLLARALLYLGPTYLLLCLSQAAPCAAAALLQLCWC